MNKEGTVTMRFWGKMTSILIPFLFCSACFAEPSGRLWFSLGPIVGAAASSIPLTATQGIGYAGAVEVGLSDAFSLGLDTGMIEFLASPGHKQDMKSIWLDLTGRFYPLRQSAWGGPYFQAGFGVSPHLGLFPDYFPNYTTNGKTEEFYPEKGAVYWDAQGSAGWFFALSGDWGLDTAFQYDYFWPPADRPLQTYSLRAAVVLSIQP